jgi:hypothetical protein
MSRAKMGVHWAWREVISMPAEDGETLCPDGDCDICVLYAPPTAAWRAGVRRAADDDHDEDEHPDRRWRVT